MTRRNKVVAILLLSAVPTLAQASPDAHTPPRDEDAKPELVALRGKLFDAGKDKALEQPSKFRPLCDAEGYPLVGNVANKRGLYQPSAFCAEVRRKANS